MNNRYKNVSIFQWNANSLRRKCADFRKLLVQYNFPILCIQEAGISDDFRLSNYVIYKSSRQGAISRVLLCVRKDLPSYQIHSSDSDFPEFVACKVSFGKLCITVINLYLQPSGRISVETLVDIFKIAHSNLFICGDFNAHNIIWGSNHCGARGNAIECAIDKCNLTVLNDGSPTFFVDIIIQAA